MNTRSIRTTAAQLTQMLADVDIATASDCISDEELVDFALGTTAEADGRLRIESHLATCSACRDDVAHLTRLAGEWRGESGDRRLAALRARVAPVLVAHSSSRKAGIHRGSRAPLERLLGGAMLRRRAVAGLALAASLLLLVLARREPAALASRLGGVAVAPTYLGIQLRGESSAADSVFQAGMNEYMERRYSHAVTFFRRSRSVDGDHARDDFFLGVSLLMTNEPVAAGESFSRVVRLGESPYRSEAYFYRAKARLRLGRIDEALGDLALAVSRRDDNSSNAAALADSVRGVAGRR